MNGWMWLATGLAGYVVMGIVTWVVDFACNPTDICSMICEKAFPKEYKDGTRTDVHWLACWAAIILGWPVYLLMEGCIQIVAGVAWILARIPFAKKLLK